MKNKSILSLAITPFLWFLFLLSTGLLLANFPHFNEVSMGNVLRINGFTMLICTVVTFFSAIISTYEGRYLAGFKFHKRFKWLSLGFTFSVILFVMANHIALFILSWFLMGYCTAQLIGTNKNWAEAKAASRFAQQNFILSTVFLCVGLMILAYGSQQTTVSGLVSNIEFIPWSLTFLAALCIIGAALVQSAIYPFQRWLLSAMTAPTPASALMHAGFINGAGILLAFFAPLFFNSHTLEILFLIGGATTIIAQFSKLLQVNVKQRLACSTIAQMGFMIMQCGLGFFNAAVAHLILHGFYKAYLFLSAGEGMKHTQPKSPEQITIKPLQAVLVILSAVLGAVVFNTFTGKGFELNSGLFLTLIVAITVGQVTYNIIKEKSFSTLQKLTLPPALYLGGIVVYSLTYNFVTAVMMDMPMVDAPQALTPLHFVFALIFLVGFIVMKLGLYQKIPWLYVKLLNLTQPSKSTFLISKNNR